MFDGSTPAKPSLASALSAAGFVGAWETNVTAGLSVLDEGASELMAGDPALAGQPLPLEQALARIHPEDRSWVFERIKLVQRTGGAFAAEFRIVTAAGDIRWIRDRGNLIATPNGMHGYGAYVDITDMRPNFHVLSQSKVSVLPTVDPLEQAVDHALAARAAINRTGQARLRTLVDTLLMEMGRALAKRQDG